MECLISQHQHVGESLKLSSAHLICLISPTNRFRSPGETCEVNRKLPVFFLSFSFLGSGRQRTDKHVLQFVEDSSTDGLTFSFSWEKSVLKQMSVPLCFRTILIVVSDTREALVSFLADADATIDTPPAETSPAENPLRCIEKTAARLHFVTS